MKKAALATLGFWIGVAAVLGIAMLINGCDRDPVNCRQLVSGAGILTVCSDPATPFWRVKRLACKAKWGVNHCHTFWTVGPSPQFDQG